MMALTSTKQIEKIIRSSWCQALSRRISFEPKITPNDAGLK